MPTQLKRTTVTHTPPVAAALKEAARQWPADAGSDSQLMRRVLHEWAERAGAERSAQRDDRAARIRQAAGGFRGVYGPDYLSSVRDGWHA